jgi:hypothetical protein
LVLGKDLSIGQERSLEAAFVFDDRNCLPVVCVNALEGAKIDLVVHQQYIPDLIEVSRVRWYLIDQLYVLPFFLKVAEFSLRTHVQTVGTFIESQRSFFLSGSEIMRPPPVTIEREHAQIVGHKKGHISVLGEVNVLNSGPVLCGREVLNGILAGKGLGGLSGQQGNQQV